MSKKTSTKAKTQDKSTSKPQQQQTDELQQQLQQAQEREKRALADYQNLIRRTQADRLKLIKLANQDFVQALIPALENLTRAAAQLDDQGLNMVVTQLWQSLKELGLEIIKPQPGDDFDLKTMDAVEKKAAGEKVLELVSQGYQLNDTVIEHAKVIVGSEKTD
ncbi:MAG: nucleotide exchange factor GrpE [Candidatus Pacebacteria bacterium]|nr:nucleotide exchange factor GrpE [Candidatus Paceibacterota bacterium]